MKRYLVLIFAPLIALLFILSACSGNNGLVHYVSEFRPKIYYTGEKDYTLYAYFSVREYPYETDGICAKTEELAEIVLYAADNTQEYEIYFEINGKTYGGDISYNAVEKNYYFSCSCPVPSTEEISFRLSSTNGEITLKAKDLTASSKLSLLDITKIIQREFNDFIKENTDRFGFHGEVCIRTVFDEKISYFIGVYTRKNECVFLLIDGVTGEVLIKK